MRDPQDGLFVQGFADDLQTYGEAIHHAGWDADAGEARKAGGNGEQVIQVHRQWVLRLGTERERDVRRRRADHGVERLEDLVEVLLDQRADLLRLEVIGVV